METTAKPMTKEEYLALTTIKSVEEARGYLLQLRVLFPLLLLLIGLSEYLKLPTPYDLYFGIFCLVAWAYFVYFCRKVIKAEKFADTSYLLSIIFAPISWIWFYPAIMEPLLIITGEKEIAPGFNIKTVEEKLAAKAKANKSFTSFMLKFIIGSIIFLVALFGALVIIFK